MSHKESAHIPEEFGELEVASNGDLVIGKSFWTVFCKEVEDIFEAVHGPIANYFDVETTSTSPSGARERGHGFYNFLLKNASAARQRKDLHPLPSQMLFLWQVYMDNVDPFIKALHVPSMTKVIREMKGHYNSFGPSMQALVLAISLAAIVSLEDEEVRVNFEADKDQLVARYRLGTEQALEEADLLYSADIVGLRALTIYLGVLQHTGEMRSAWFLSGVLVRVAVSIKLHRDGSHLGDISLFEKEMRRRLWWQICFVDCRSDDLQLADFKLSERLFDTRPPVNTDDAYLDPTISGLPIIADRWTDMTVCLIRCEVWKVSSRIQSARADTQTPETLHKRHELFQQSQATIEDMLKHLDHSQPLHTFVATSARLFLINVDLVLRTAQYPPKSTAGPNSDVPQSDSLFMLSILKIEYTYALQNEPSWSGWRWQNHGHQSPWHALHVVLSQLCTHDWQPIYERGWSSAKRSFDGLPEAARQDVRYQQLSVQMNRANELHQQNLFSKASRDDTTSAKPVTLSPLTQQSRSVETASTWTAQEPFTPMVDDPSNYPLSDLPSFEMDWQTWDELTADFDPCMELWGSSGF